MPKAKKPSKPAPRAAVAKPPPRADEVQARKQEREVPERDNGRTHYAGPAGKPPDRTEW